jgi:hypothetical protein
MMVDAFEPEMVFISRCAICRWVESDLEDGAGLL